MARPRVSRVRRETDLERWDRNFHELLQELRLAQTGAHIVLAFLLAYAFSERFAAMNSLRTVYLLTLGAASAAVILFLAPVGLHRTLFRRGLKPRIVILADRLVRVGLGCVLIAIVGTIFLIVHPIAGIPTATVFGAATFLFGGAVWYALPIRERRRTRHRSHP
jgi:hypothetical protein